MAALDEFCGIINTKKTYYSSTDKLLLQQSKLNLLPVTVHMVIVVCITGMFRIFSFLEITERNY